MHYTPGETTHARKFSWRGILVPMAAASVVVAAGSWCSPPSVACEIPVFRFALERWAPDPYQVFLLHSGPLAATDEKLAADLEKLSDGADKPSNLDVVKIDLEATGDDPAVKALKKQYGQLKSPLLLLRDPHGAFDKPPIWSGPLTSQNIALLADSPLRHQIVHQINAGNSAVWVLLESGVAADDTAAATMLDTELKRNAATLKLPEKETLEADEYYKHDTKIPLKIGFSLLRLKHGDTQEELLRAMLLATEPDLKDQHGPIAIPIFGRGRACYPLVGKGINAVQIEDNCKFITGRCSCQVKRENPGIDLLLAADWNNLVGGKPSSSGAKPPPELTGLGVVITDVEPAKAPVKSGPPPASTPDLLDSKLKPIDPAPKK
ncbi:MAG: hypothetical protein K8T25_11015 [Planctomycetia bacterium]|nr:hypothetical protein [Planctomycetia bacterium]